MGVWHPRRWVLTPRLSPLGVWHPRTKILCKRLDGLHFPAGMDVRCDKCGSEYELDDNRVTATGVSVKCTSCGHVFRVTKATPTTRQATTGDWMIRQASGQVFKFKELTTLQRWIVERRVT